MLHNSFQRRLQLQINVLRVLHVQCARPSGVERHLHCTVRYRVSRLSPQALSLIATPSSFLLPAPNILHNFLFKVV